MFSVFPVLPRDSFFTFQKKLYLGYIFVYFPHSDTNGRIQCPLAVPGFFTVYLGDRSLSNHIEFLCSFIWLHSSLFREAP